MISRCKVVATGLYLPPNIQTSSELAQRIDRSEDWIISRTGVEQRHIAHEHMDVMAAKAAKPIVEKYGAPDCIINASLTPVQLIPDSSVFIQNELGLTGIPSWSVHATCLSFLVAFVNSAALLQGGAYKRILVVSAEAGSNWRNLKEPESASLFGDAAAAVLLEISDDKDQGLLDWQMNTWPEGAELTEFRGGGTRRPPYGVDTAPDDYLFHMKGPKVFRMVLKRIHSVLGDLFDRNGMEFSDIDRFILHQASGPGMEGFANIGFPKEKTVNIVSDHGNCIAASIPMTLAIADQRGLLKRGDKLLLGGTGAGLSIAFAIVQW